MGLQGRDWKAAGVGRGKEKMITTNCDKMVSALTLTNSVSVHFWIHICAMQTNASCSQSQNSISIGVKQRK